MALLSKCHCSAVVSTGPMLHALFSSGAPPLLEKGYKSVRFPTGPDLVCLFYPTGLHQTIPSAYPVPSIHLQVSFPKTKEQNGSSTDLLLIVCKREKTQYTTVQECSIGHNCVKIMQACLFQHISLLQISCKNKSPLYSEILTALFNFLFLK